MKTTSDIEFDATVDQTDMRGLGTARPDPSGPSSVYWLTTGSIPLCRMNFRIPTSSFVDGTIDCRDGELGARRIRNSRARRCAPDGAICPGCGARGGASIGEAIGGLSVDKQYVRTKLAASKALGNYELDIPGSGSRKARRASMAMHAMEVTLLLRDKNTKERHPLRINVVWVHEVGTTPSGETPLDWMLFTNAPIDTVEAARRVVLGYSLRWRIEEFHKTWKTGKCNVELT
jgi:hypothetical protein